MNRDIASGFGLTYRGNKTIPCKRCTTRRPSRVMTEACVYRNTLESVFSIYLGVNTRRLKITIKTSLPPPNSLSLPSTNPLFPRPPEPKLRRRRESLQARRRQTLRPIPHRPNPIQHRNQRGPRERQLPNPFRNRVPAKGPRARHQEGEAEGVPRHARHPGSIHRRRFPSEDLAAQIQVRGSRRH